MDPKMLVADTGAIKTLQVFVTSPKLTEGAEVGTMAMRTTTMRTTASPKSDLKLALV